MFLFAAKLKRSQEGAQGDEEMQSMNTGVFKFWIGNLTQIAYQYKSLNSLTEQLDILWKPEYSEFQLTAKTSEEPQAENKLVSQPSDSRIWPGTAERRMLRERDHLSILDDWRFF